MSVKTRRFILFAVVLIAAVLFLVPVVFRRTFVGPMVAMPLILTRDGNPIPAKEIESLRYAFRETPTSFERISVEQMKDAKPFLIGFLVDAPYTTTRTWMFGPRSTTPEYRSLTIQLTFVAGDSFTMSIPVLSDTALNSPIQIDVSSKKQ
jgi:hypothetical protein